MNTYLMYGTFVLLGLLLVCWFINLILVQKKGEPSLWASRGLYIFGLLAVVLNAVRVGMTAKTYPGTLVFANIVAFICILIAFIRMEKEHKNKGKE